MPALSSRHAAPLPAAPFALCAVTFSNPFGYAADAPAAYVRALLDVLGDRDPLAVLTATPDALRGATAGLAEDAARRPEAPGKWSVLEVVRHLADSEVVYGYRARLIVAAERPAVPGYDQDAWAARLRYRDGALADALDDLAAVRGVNLRWLRARTPDELARIGLHAERGEESLLHLTRLMAAHDLVHLRQTARVRAALGV